MSLSPLSIAGVVSYDGTDFCGFQYQKDVPTIQGALEESIGAFATVAGRVVGAGRTDCGVHAIGQVIGARVQWRHDVESLQRAWNAHLPPTVRIRSLSIVSDAFHPRFSAIRREYRYYIHQGAKPKSDDLSPLTSRFVLFEPSVLDIDAMDRAAQILVGTHDFATFGQPPQGNSTVRRVVFASCRRVKTNLPLIDDFGPVVVFVISANAFLRHMVRNLTGTLLEVGRGRLSVAEVSAILAAKKRSLSAPPVTPKGLVLEKVIYPNGHIILTSGTDESIN